MAFNQPADGNDGAMSDINMTPLVDVMLVLLIIFMITVPVLTQTVDIELPSQSADPMTSDLDDINIAVDAAGVLHWNKDIVSATELEQKLTRLTGQASQPQIYLRGDRKVPYGKIMQVMAAIQKSGLQKIGFITQPD